MSAPPTDAIFEFLGGTAPRPGTAAARVRAAVLNPGTDPDADAALVKFRKAHRDLLEAPRVRSAVAAFQQKMARELADAEAEALPFAEPIPDPPPPPPKPTWRDLFDRLVAHCRAEFGRATATAPAPVGTAESLVSTILSSYIAGAEAGRYRALHDPQQLWPVLLEIAARKMKQKLTAATVADARFADVMSAVLEFTFRDVAKDDARRLVLVHALFGREPKEIEKRTGQLTEDVASVVRTLHTDLHLHLTVA